MHSPHQHRYGHYGFICQICGEHAESRSPAFSAAPVIKFNKHNVSSGGVKARVFYSLDNRTDRRPCVTIYAKDYSRELGKIFAAEYRNDTDSMSDYFDQGRVVLFADHPLYAAARARAEAK